MRRFIYAIAIISLAIISCQKPNASLRPATPALNGSWRRILVTDNVSGLATTKPVTIPNDVDITFTSLGPGNGTFTGVTPTNQIWENGYSTGAGQTIAIPELGITKAWETDWGYFFVGNIRSSLSYTLGAGNILDIRTVNKTLRFRKLP